MSKRVALLLAGWLAIAALLGGSGLWLRLPAPAVGGAVWLLLAAQVVFWWRSPAFARFLHTVDPRVLVLPHVARLVGIELLLLGQAGRLPMGFAVPSGWGDIVAALGAIAVAAFCVPVRGSLRRAVLLVWNTCGTIDLLLVVFNALRFFLTRPAEMEPLRALPYCLLPTFLVPVLLFSHAVLFARFGSSRRLDALP